MTNFSDSNVFQYSNSSSDGEHWLTISDLMAGLMIVFLFIAIAYMRHTTIERDKIKNVAVAYKENQVAIFNALNTEFMDDLKIWEASIEKDSLAFQFHSPDVLFRTGKCVLRDEFKIILTDFIPRYIEVLNQYINSISEIRIEGHTSSEWGNEINSTNAYFHNMSLSQERTLSVLKFAYHLPQLTMGQKQWIKASFAAVGLASSHLKTNPDGTENKKKSRRVTFRVITNADIQIRKIIDGV